MTDMRFILRVSVGLIVRAPSPVAWEACETPGITDARFDDRGWAAFLLPGLGDRGIPASVFPRSGVRLLTSEVSTIGTRGGGWTDLALEALDAVRFLVASPPSRLPPSIDERADPGTGLSEFEAMLGRRRCVVRLLAYSGSKTPGPTDFLGGLPMLLFDTGG